MQAAAELTLDKKHIAVLFPYHPLAVTAIKRISGSRFVPRENGGPYWLLPLDIFNARQLRDIFGDGLRLGPRLRRWGRHAIAEERHLRELATATDADLDLDTEYSELALYLRPYQRADVAMMAATNVLNANQPGTGKTVEVIAAIHEAGMHRGAHLISAPVRSLENVWAVELERWSSGSVHTAEELAARRAAVAYGLDFIHSDEPVWICVNPDMLRLRKLTLDDPDSECVYRDHKGNRYGARDELQRRILDVQWTTFTIDEFHKAGLNSTTTLFRHGVSCIKAKRRYALSGTPMGGKPIKLFPVLQWIEPEIFTSKWRWAERWLGTGETELGHKTIGSAILPEREENFYTAHARHMVRRTKREALPGLPPQVHITISCGMEPRQAEQYAEFEERAEIAIQSMLDETHSEQVIATCILAEFTRLKQFANAYCKLLDDEVTPTEISGKLPHLLERLEEFGICKYEPEPGARAIIASQSTRMVAMVSAWLRRQGIDCDELTGKTKHSAPIIARFQNGSVKPYCIVMTTQTGGVSLNLEAAGSVHILDESWNPDDEEQLADRGDRGSRTTPLVICTYRTRGTIQEYIAEVAAGKRMTNRTILDVYRRSIARAE